MFVFSATGDAQELLHWREWRDPDTPLGLNTGWIYVGPKGGIWVGQVKGEGFLASRFDGYRAYSIPEVSRALTIREGRSGQIWAVDIDFPLAFTTLRRMQAIALGRYVYGQDLTAGEWILYPLGEKSSLNLPIIPFVGAKNVIPSTGDSLLILYQDRLIETDPAAGKTTTLRSSEETNLGGFIHMVESQDGGLWITAERGLAKVVGLYTNGNRTRMSPEWEVWPFPSELGLKDLAIPIEVHKGEVFGAASSIKDGRRHLVRFEDSAWEIIPTAGEQEVVMGWRGTDDMVWVLNAESIVDPLVPFGWIGTDMGNWISCTLCWIQEGKEHVVQREFGSSSYLWYVAAEPGGAFWLAQDRGMTRYAPATWRVPPGLGELQKNVFASHEDGQGRLWFLASDALLCFDQGKWSEIPVPKIEPFERRTSSQSICSFPDGRVVFVTNDSWLFVANAAADPDKVLQVTHPAGRTIMAVESRKEGGVWVATANESSWRTTIEIFDGDHFEEVLGEEENLPLGTRFFRLLESSSGDLWMAGAEAAGLYRNGEYCRFEISDGVQPEPFMCLLEMDDGRIWMGGREKTLADIVEFDGEKWRNVAGGISYVKDIVRRRDGTVWVASTSGVYRHVEGTWVLNRQKDGLYPDVYTLLEDRQGRFWAGTSRGIFLYHPEVDPDPPKTTIREEDNLRETPPGGEVRIVYSGIDRWNYTEAERLLYSHRIDGGPWSEFSREKIATFSGLSSGEHTFEVRAVDRNWNVEPAPASFRFTVLVPWYQNAMFLILLVVGSGTILFLLGLHLYHHLNLESIVAKRTSALRQAYSQLRTIASELSRTEERERRQLAADLHDSISQSLSVSMMELAAMGDAKAADEIRDHTSAIRERLDEAFQATQNLTFDLCPPELYQVGLESAIRELTIRIQKQHGIEIAFDDDRQPKPMSDDTRYFLFRATRELLLNVVKHAHATAVRVSIKKENASIQIRVSDDGVGFELTGEHVYASERGSFGLFSIRERAHQLGGSLTVESEPGRGTQVTVAIPLSDVVKQEDGGAES
jgi:signal transduction histidine kinase